MSEDKISCNRERRRGGNNGAIGGGYFLAFIGIAVYYIQQAETFGQGLLGFLKAIVWPAFFAYKVFEFLKM